MSFLSNLLPTIAGGAAMYFSGGTINPATIAALTGGLQYARTGSLGKGIAAGLGAYGGASLAGGLAGVGTSEAGAELAKANQAAATKLGEDASARDILMARDASAANTMAANPMQTGISAVANDPSKLMTQMGGKGLATAGLMAAAPMFVPQQRQAPAPTGDSTMPQRLQYNVGRPMDVQGQAITPPPDVPSYESGMGQNFGRQQNYFPYAGFQNITAEQAKQMRGYAEGGYMGGGPVEQMSNANAVGQNTGYPQADIQGHAYATPWQSPVSENVVQGTADTGVNRLTGQMLATGGIADAHYNLGGYSDGGRLLKGPGDGVSDSIPATIGNKRPARLADGEFVVPARIVSELGNGSTDAGARKLYAMLDRVQKARGKTVGKGKVAKNSRADKYLPA